MTNLSVATPSNPTHLPARYEIRRLTEAHIPWASAMVCHANMFYSPVWPVVYPEGKTARLYQGFTAADYLVRHQISSGHSFGVFDLEYRFRRPESQPGGKLHWDLDDTDADADRLLEQMDFPLVSIALAYDGFNALDFDKMGPMMECLPLFGAVYHLLEAGDTRDGSSWKPTAPNQVLLRNATATRHDAEGHGIMRKLAEFLMRYAAEQGFRAIQIECLQDAVTKVWSQPPTPFKGTLVAEFRCEDIEEERQTEAGETVKVKVFGQAKQRATKIFVDLRPDAANGQVPYVAQSAVGALG